MQIKAVTVIGSGVMGSQISQVLASRGFSILMHDVNETQLQSAMDRIEHGPFGLRKGVDRGLFSEEDVNQALGRITPTTNLIQACQEADMVLEVVPEDIGLKIDIFRQVDKVAPAHAILASNTAGLPITALAHATDRQDQVIGWHWFQPCSVMKLAELVVHPGTSAETRDLVIEAAKRAGKNPVVVKDFPQVWGFVGNRINRAVRQEAAQIVSEGIASKDDVDTIMRDGFRWPMGPFEMQGMGSKK